MDMLGDVHVALIAYESVTAPMQISIFRLMDDESKGRIIDVVDVIARLHFFRHFFSM